MYAIFRAKGKQFRAEPDATLRIPSLDLEPGERIRFDEVLLAADGGEVSVGTPALEGASVEAEVVRHGRGRKIIVYKMKRRKGYRRKQGHRQKFTEVRIVGIDVPTDAGARPARKEEPAAEQEATVEAPEAAVEAPEAEAAEPATTGEAEAAQPESEVEGIEATDAARELADEHDLDLTEVEGTGQDGRILKGDVQEAIRAREEEEDA